jgi:hypothetical protein
MRKVVAFFSVLLLLTTVVACDSALGESCEEEGRVDGECDDGTVCGKQSAATDSSLVCLKQCSSQADCNATEECAVVPASSLKGCRTKR